MAVGLRRSIFAFGVVAGMASLAQGRTVNVNSSATLNTALSGALPGDVIVLASGNYSGFTVNKSGTAISPIVIESATQGGATVTSGVVELNAVSYVTLQGLTITTPGSTLTIDGTSRKVAVWLAVAQSCEVTRCTFHLNATAGATQWCFLSGASNNNRVDHCEFGPNTMGDGTHFIWPSGNPTIPGYTPPADRTPLANGNGPFNPNMTRNTTVDHNYFHDQASGQGEAMVLGAIGDTGDYQNCNTVLQYNLFVNCNGDPEVVSVKSSSNILRYNTVVTSAGVFSLRAGNKNQVYGNFFLCGGIGGGIKMSENDHIVYNNYMENSDTSNYPLMLEGGDAYSSPTFAHAQVHRAHIIYNTFFNVGRQVLWSHDGGLPPTDCIMANNIITGASGKTLYSDSATPINAIYSQNVVSPAAVSGKTAAQFRVLNPGFVEGGAIERLTATSPVRRLANGSYFPFVLTDIDGQARGLTPDIGCDQYSTANFKVHPMSVGTVGPNAP